MSEQKKLHWRDFFKSEHLAAADLDPGEERTLTIAAAGWGDVPVPGSPKKEKKLVVSFVEKSKPMVVNATNSRTISAIAGTGIIEGWVGHRIQVYQSMTKFKGEDTECLRIRPFEPKGNSKEVLAPGSPKWDQAVQKYSTGSIGLEKLCSFYELSDENAKLLQQEAANA